MKRFHQNVHQLAVKIIVIIVYYTYGCDDYV